MQVWVWWAMVGVVSRRAAGIRMSEKSLMVWDFLLLTGWVGCIMVNYQIKGRLK